MKNRYYAMAAALTGLTMIIGCTSNPTGTTNTNNTNPTPTPTVAPTQGPAAQTTWDPLPFEGFPADAKLTGRVLGTKKTWNVQYVENVTGGLAGSEISPIDGNGYFWFFSPVLGKNYYYSFRATEPFAAHTEDNITGTALSNVVTVAGTLNTTTPLTTVNLGWNGNTITPVPGGTLKVGKPVNFSWAVPDGWAGATCSLRVYKQSPRAFSSTSAVLFNSDATSPTGISGNTFTWHGFKQATSAAATADITDAALSVVIIYGTPFKPGSLTSKNLQYTKE